MKLLLVQDLGYLHWGGGLKLNRIVVGQVASLGHECRAVVLHQGFAEIAHDLEHEAAIEVRARGGDRYDLLDAGVEVSACLNFGAFEREVMRQLATFEPDCIVFNTGEYGYARLSLLPDKVLARTVVSVLVLEALPFGPHAFAPDPAASERLARVGGMIVMNRRLAAYVREWGQIEPRVLYFPAYGDGPFPDLGSFDDGYVTLINVSVMKGLPIFLALARAFPATPFAAVPTWGTTEESLDALAAVDNVTVLEPRADIDDLFRQTRILLVPSLWHEAFGLVVVEAMLRGIPVLASDVGGLPEAKLGIDYLLPVTPLTSRPLPGGGQVLDVPDQRLGPWVSALARLLSSRPAYGELSRASREAAHDHVAQTTVVPFVDYFREVAERGRGATAGCVATVK